VTTTAHSMVTYRPRSGPWNIPIAFLAAVLFVIAFLATLLRLTEKRMRWSYALAVLLLVGSGTLLSACGGGSGGGGSTSGTPAGNYALTVTGVFNSGSTTLTHNSKLTLVVQ